VTRGQFWGIAALSLALMGSAIAVVHTKYATRKLFVELEHLRAQRDLVDVEWGQLRLEQSTWSTHGRVHRMALERLNMRAPRPEDIVVISP
jgi:cell division protein FtsL